MGLHAAPQDQLPNYWEWASHNALFDNFFASAQGPSFPNHCTRSRPDPAARTTTRVASPDSGPSRSGVTRRTNSWCRSSTPRE